LHVELTRAKDAKGGYCSGFEDIAANYGRNVVQGYDLTRRASFLDRYIVVKSESVSHTGPILLWNQILVHAEGDEGDSCMGGFTDSLACAAFLLSANLLVYLGTDDS
jgi:hypothetical protein